MTKSGKFLVAAAATFAVAVIFGPAMTKTQAVKQTAPVTSHRLPTVEQKYPWIALNDDERPKSDELDGIAEVFLYQAYCNSDKRIVSDKAADQMQQRLFQVPDDVYSAIGAIVLSR